jgi:hypothetical protein
MLRRCPTVEFQRLDSDADKVEFKRLDPDAEKVTYRRVPEA